MSVSEIRQYSPRSAAAPLLMAARSVNDLLNVRFCVRFIVSHKLIISANYALQESYCALFEVRL